MSLQDCSPWLISTARDPCDLHLPDCDDRNRFRVKVDLGIEPLRHAVSRWLIFEKLGSCAREHGEELPVLNSKRTGY